MMKFWRDFIDGMASIFNLAGSPPPRLPVSNPEIDRLNKQSLADDWNAVGGDMRKAITALEEKKRAEGK